VSSSLLIRVRVLLLTKSTKSAARLQRPRFSAGEFGNGGPEGGVDGRASSHGGGDLPAALGQGALVLVHVLVAAEGLRAVELTVAVGAAEEAGLGLLRSIWVQEAELKVQLLLLLTRLHG
jgi:hypothetical protein